MEIQLRGIAVVHAKLDQRERIFADLESMASDFAFRIQVLQQKIAARHAAHQRLENYPSRLLAG